LHNVVTSKYMLQNALYKFQSYKLENLKFKLHCHLAFKFVHFSINLINVLFFYKVHITNYKIFLKFGNYDVCHNQGKGLQRCAPRMKHGNHISCYIPRECRKAWRNEHPHSQMSRHFGSWNPDGVSNFQRETSVVKTHLTKELFVSLESF
jgi:hypothetical protein